MHVCWRKASSYVIVERSVHCADFCECGVQASESRSMRGMKRMASDAAARFKQQQAANGQGQYGQDDTAHGAKPVNGNPTTDLATRNGV